MGAKTWMLVYAEGDASAALKAKPRLDRDATLRLAATLFPDEKLEEVGAGNLASTNPPDDEIYIGCFPEVAVVAASEFGNDYPSKLFPRFLGAAPFPRIYLHAMHSVVDWFAYAHWSNGTLVRALSLSPDSGVLEDIGRRLPFEEPFWSGLHPAVDPSEGADDYPFPLHPLDLGEAALRALFGYCLEGPAGPTSLEPESIVLLRLKRSRSRWKFWQ